MSKELQTRVKSAKVLEPLSNSRVGTLTQVGSSKTLTLQSITHVQERRVKPSNLIQQLDTIVRY